MAIQIWQPGDKIKNDRFHILKQLGKGGFGITYLAEDTVKKQQIVIKTLNANQQGEADFAQKQENFVKEGFTLKTFNHPHIVKVYEPIQIGELWGLVMEYIPGQDLADYIIANGRLGEAEALNYIDQIAQALDCVHQQKFFHRDVKPHNIMLRQDRGEAVLIDFGIAKEFVDLETIYLSNSLGTELYKPIEQYEKRGQFGAYTDIYALAVTLYHLLTGAAPGGGSPLYTSKARKDAQDRGWGDKLDEHLWGELANAGVSERTQSAIRVGMGIEPSQRPQNMTEFRKLLKLVTTSPITNSNLGLTYTIESSQRPQMMTEFWLFFKSLITAPITNSNPGLIYTINLLAERNQKNTHNHSLLMAKFREFMEFQDKVIIKTEIEGEFHVEDNYFEHGEKLLKLGCYLRSDEFALNFGQDDPHSWCNRGIAMANLCKHEKAIIRYDLALKNETDDYFIWYLRGNSLEKLGKYEEAVISYDRALELKVDEPNTWINRGIAMANSGKDFEALDSFDRALKIEPDNYKACKNRKFLLDRHWIN
jgi:serine/threonine protein kinase